MGHAPFHVLRLSLSLSLSLSFSLSISLFFSISLSLFNVLFIDMLSDSEPPLYAKYGLNHDGKTRAYLIRCREEMRFTNAYTKCPLSSSREARWHSNRVTRVILISSALKLHNWGQIGYRCCCCSLKEKLAPLFRGSIMEYEIPSSYHLV
jgi:hypothetical protein